MSPYPPFYSTSPEIDRAILRLIGGRVRRTASWDEFQNLASRSACAVIALDCAHEETCVDRIQRLTKRAALTRFLLVIEDRAVNDDLLGRAAVVRVVRLSRAEYQLAPSLSELLEPEDLSWIPAAVAGARHIRSTVRRAITLACTRPPPVPSIRELAPLVHCPRETLSRDWNLSRAGRLDLRLNEFMDWIILLWACLLRPRSRSWMDAAVLVGARCPTLEEHARRLARLALREIDAQDEGGYNRVRKIFETEVLTPLVGEQDHISEQMVTFPG